MTRRSVGVVVATLALAGTTGGCAVSEIVQEDVASAAPRLVPFSGCSELVDYLRANASIAQGGIAVGGEPIPPPIVDDFGAEEAAPAPSEPPAEPAPAPEPAPAEPAPPAAEPAAPAEAPAPAPAPAAEPAPAEPAPSVDAASPPPAPSTGGRLGGDQVPVRSDTPPDGFSVTNVQEAGVDEPDIVKTDGTRLFALAGGTIQAVDLTGPRPRVVGTFRISGIGEPSLLYAGNRLVVMGTGERLPLAPDSGLATTVGPRDVARLLVVDVSDPSRMQAVGAVSVEGTFVSARLTGTTARVVVSSQPRVLPSATQGDWLDDWAAESQLGVDADAAYEQWVPRLAIEDVASGRVGTGPIVPCGAVSRPEVFSGYGFTSVVTLDLATGIVPVDRDAVLGDAATVYASPTSLYVATQPWAGDAGLDGRTATSIHRFDASDARQTSYRASGAIAGWLLNQWSLSEHDGVLRVATTAQPPWWEGNAATESGITTLSTDGDELQQLGHVGGLGKDERIFGVRFVGDVGYVVTFRQTDPLYTVDLSDPAEPRVLGELKIPGYSAYLHPLGDGLLLGIGQDATETGQVLGTQISLFDVSELDNPRRLHKRTLDGASSEVETDHHAFLWWAKRQLGVMPVEGPVPGGDLTGDGWFTGAVGFTADRASGIAPEGVVAHPGEARIRRALVVGNELLTVSERGVETNDLDTFERIGWASFDTSA